MSKVFQEAGVHISEPELAKAMGQAFEKELTTQTAFKKLAREFELQAQKKGVPKTALSSNNYPSNGHPSSANAQKNLSKKMAALEKAQQKAVKVIELDDGRIRYYEAFRASNTPGPTIGGSFVTEHNPRTGKVRCWNECYNVDGNVNRVHPKAIDGQDIVGQHYPPTRAEIEAFLK